MEYAQWLAMARHGETVDYQSSKVIINGMGDCDAIAVVDGTSTRRFDRSCKRGRDARSFLEQIALRFGGTGYEPLERATVRWHERDLRLTYELPGFLGIVSQYPLKPARASPRPQG